MIPAAVACTGGMAPTALRFLRSVEQACGGDKNSLVQELLNTVARATASMVASARYRAQAAEELAEGEAVHGTGGASVAGLSSSTAVGMAVLVIAPGQRSRAQKGATQRRTRIVVCQVLGGLVGAHPPLPAPPPATRTRP